VVDSITHNVEHLSNGRLNIQTKLKIMGSIKGQKHNPYIEGNYGHLNPNDVVFTPDWLAKQIVDMFPIEGKVLEPCKGEPFCFIFVGRKLKFEYLYTE
jgi:hypothetical protein